MQNTSKLLRAVTAVFARRLIKRVLLLVSAVGLMLVVAIVLLIIKVDALWAFAFVVVLPILAIVVAIVGVAWFATSYVLPRKLSKKESKEIHSFTTRIFEVVGRAKTPWPLLAGSIIKSVLLRRESNVLSEVISDSKTLKTEFIRLRDSMS